MISETIQLVNLINDVSFAEKISNIIAPISKDGIELYNFNSLPDLKQHFSKMDVEERDNVAVFYFNFSDDNNHLLLQELFENYISHARKIMFLHEKEALAAIQFANRSNIDKFIFFPVDEKLLLDSIEHLIEVFLEDQILRRSLNEIRQTYETMKIQFQEIQEANFRLDKKIMELNTLSEIGSYLMATYEEYEIFHETALAILGQKGASSVVVFLRNESENFMTMKFHKGIVLSEEQKSLKFPINESIFKHLSVENRSCFISEISIPDKLIQIREFISIFSFEILIPLISKEEIKGFILLGKKITDENYSKDDFEFFSVLANQLIFAIENAHLYEKLEAKIVELEKANKELRQLDRMKSEFITIASHELRTPLTAVRGYIELLLAGKFDDLSQTQFKALEVINKNIDRLIQISDDVVQLSKIDADRLSINLIPATIDKITKDIVEDSTPFAHLRQISLKMDVAKDCPVVLVDPLLIQQAISELIKNAIRFTQDGGNILVKIKPISANTIPSKFLPEHHFGKFLWLSVKDDGIGIPPEEYKHIFERFYEIQHSSYHHSGTYGFKSGGTGLGLAIVKGVVEKHGGSIWVTSGIERGNRGSIFSIILPIPNFT